MKNYWLQQAKKKRIKSCNARFLQEARELAAKWETIGLLDKLPDRWIRGSTAVLLESQRLFEE